MAVPIVAAIPPILKAFMAWMAARGVTKVASKAAAKTAAKYIGKHPFGSLAVGGGLAMTGIGEYGRAGERRLAGAEIDVQRLMQEYSAEAAQKMTKESRASTERMIKTLMEERAVEAARERESQLMQAYMENQNRQMAMVLQSVQGATRSPFSGGGGMTGLMRGEF